MSSVQRTVAIVVNWNGCQLTRQCLDDLAASALPLDVLVVDNGSTDESVQVLREHASQPEVLSLSSNRGYGAALNMALAHVRDRSHEFVWLLNNDVRVPSDCHRLLVSEAEREGTASLWTPRLVSPDGARQHIGGVWRVDGSRSRLVTADDAHPVDREGFWLTGTALFCRMDTALRIGAFDESFFAYWEDVDWSLRADRRGVRLRVATEAAITHMGSQASGGQRSALSTFLNARNELVLVRRHVPRASRRQAVLRLVARQLRSTLVLERVGGRELAEAALAGLTAGLAGQRGAPRVVPLPAPLVTRVLDSALAIAHRLDRAAAHATPHVSVCIVSYNTRELLRACLQALGTATATRTVEIIVVDNASDDESAAMVAREFPHVQCIASPSNIGFAAAANIAMRAASGATVLWLNPDAILPPAAVDRLCDFLDTHPDVDACGPALVYPDGTFQTCGRRFPTIATELHDAVGEWWMRGPFRRWRNHRPAAAGPVDWLCGACVLVRRTALEQVGLFDEAFFLYGEELDWFARARRLGLVAWALPDIVVVHHLGQSAASIGHAANVHLRQTRQLYYRRHRSRLQAAAVRVVHRTRRR